LHIANKILAIPGVKAVTPNNWFGGVYQDEKNFFPQFVIDVEKSAAGHDGDESSDDQWKNFVKRPAGRKLLERDSLSAWMEAWRSAYPLKTHCMAPRNLGVQPGCYFTRTTTPAETKASSGCSGNT